MGDACEAGCFNVQCWQLGDREELYSGSVQLISANGLCGVLDQNGCASGL